MAYIRKEMWLAIVERRSAPYAPYVQHLINTVFYRTTHRRLDQEMGEAFLIHEPLSLWIKHHEAPRTNEERMAAEAATAEIIRAVEIIRAAVEAGERPPTRVHAHARARVAATAPPPPPPPPMQNEPSDRKSTRLNSSHITRSRMPSSA